MNCPNCGAPVAPGIPYCPTCHAATGQMWSSAQQSYRQGPVPGQSWQQPAQSSSTPAFSDLTTAPRADRPGQSSGYTSALPDFAPRQPQQPIQPELRRSSQGGQSYPQQGGSFGQESFRPQSNDAFNAGVFTPPGQPGAGFDRQQTQPVNSYAPQASGGYTAQGSSPYGTQTQPVGSFAPQASGGYAAQGSSPYSAQTQPVGSFAPQAAGTYAAQGSSPYGAQTQPVGSFAPQAASPYGAQAQPATPPAPQASTAYNMQAASPYGAQAQPGGSPARQPYQSQAANAYGQQGYPQPTAQSYAYQGQLQQHPNPVMALLSELPRMFLGCFTAPGQVLRTLVERGDVITGPMVLAVALVVVFLGGMAAMRGVVSVLFSFITSLTGISLAGSSSALRQGVNYIAGQIAPAVGGIAVLCQVIAIIIPVAVIMVYLYLVHHQQPNWMMALEMVTVTTMPTIAVALVAMVASMISPMLALVVMIVGIVIAYLQLSHMLSTLLGGTPEQELLVKLICFPIALLLTLGLIYLLGGNLMSGVFQHMISLLGNMGAAV